MSQPNGGPAFPFSAQVRYTNELGHAGMTDFCGMTLRQWYAGLAMQGMIIRTDAIGMAKAETLASWAYQQADAMLAQRGQP